MYKNHKKILRVVFIIVFFISFMLKINFAIIASDCISIVSFALAIYTICISCLIGSPLLENLRLMPDFHIKEKTQLGVIKCYIVNASYTSLATLIMAYISKLTFNISVFDGIENEFITSILYNINWVQIFSSLCFSLFSLNFAFIIIIFIFIISKQLT